MRGQRLAISALTISAFLALAGCMSTGVKVSEQEATSFVVGKSTYAEVVAKLGDPTTTTLSSDGDRTATYSYSAMQERPESFLPYIGGLVGGVDTKSSEVAFIFDKDGILLRTSSSQSQAGVGENFSAGAPIARSPSQK